MEEVKNGPKSTIRIKLSKPIMVTRIINFHPNSGNGASAGIITFAGKRMKRVARGIHGMPREVTIIQMENRFVNPMPEWRGAPIKLWFQMKIQDHLMVNPITNDL